MKCPDCPRRPEDTCAGESDRRVCGFARDRRAAGIPTYRTDEKPTDWKGLLAVETCRARKSECNCLARPATCSRDGPPVEVLCLTAGPGGTVCPGA